MNGKIITKKFFRFLVFPALLLAGSNSFAQTFENSWINPGQEYFKIKVWQTGVHRITPSTSQIPFLIFSNAQFFQLWHNGVEQYIYVSDTDAPFGIINGNDYIEYYGEKNDGKFDTQLYQDPSWQPNPNYSLFTDTSIYFLTYDVTRLGLRFIETNDTNFPNYSK